MKFLKIGIPVIVVAGILGWFLWPETNSGNGNLPPLNKVTVEEGDIAQRVVAFGALQPVQKVEVGSQVSGIVDQIYVDFNTPVSKNQILARIDPSTFEAAVSSAKAELESSKAALQLAEIQYNRIQELRERQFVSLSDVDEASANLRQAQAQVQVRQHALERAERELERCTIVAPTDGIIISRAVDLGQTVAASLNAPLLFEIATDLRQMHIYALVSEADIGVIEDGQRVVFRVDAHRNRNFEGTIIQVRNAPVISDNVVHYETLIEVDNSELLLKPGMTTEVNIITDEVHDVVKVRNTALRARLPDSLAPEEAELEDDYNGRVVILENGRLLSRAVQTGISDGVNTEIKQGVSPGDTLVVGLTLATEGSEQRRSLFGGQQATF